MKDNIAFAAVILTFVIGGLAAWAFQPVERRVLTLLNVDWFKPAAPAEVRYLPPITVIGYRDPSDPRPSKVASAQSQPAPDATGVDAGFIDR